MVEIKEITIQEISNLIKEKKISVKELVEEYLHRIEKLDQGSHGLNSVLEINPDALEIAGNLDNRHFEGSSLLFGVPILLKDNINTADQMHTSAGSLALADNIPSKDAEIVSILRSKGAVILGKTNMTEFANYMTKGMPPGYSSRGGYVKSPYREGVDPSGSSTGSAVAVTANLCAASIGTDTSGSIISPATNNSIVGFRPSMGSLSQKGIIPISFTCDTAGPMTRTVSDAAIIYSELTSINGGSENSRNRLLVMKEDGEKADGKGCTLGINEWSLKNMDTEKAKKAESILKEIEKAGVQIQGFSIEPLPKDQIKGIQRYEFKYAINRYLSNLPKEYRMKSLRDIIQFNQEHPETLRYGQELLIDAEENTRGDLSENEYIELLKNRERLKMQTYEILRGIDAYIMFTENLLLHLIGLPVITIPHGMCNDGTPYGICLTGLTDTDLLNQALFLEKLVGQRKVPLL